MKQNVLITGASRGIGKAIAFAFASEGYHLYLTCVRRMDLLQEVKNEIQTSFSVPCEIFQCDCSQYEQVSRLFSILPDIHILINNAGISYVGLLSEMDPSDWDHIIQTNLTSVFYTCKMAIPTMVRAQKGRILNISSVWGNQGASMEVAYSASKGGVNSFTKALAKELAPSKITVNAIACGLIDTQMNQCFSKEELKSVIEEIPCDRMGSPKEIGDLCLMLANSPTYLTGQIITIDGGWS